MRARLITAIHAGGEDGGPMAATPRPTVRKQRLGSELRRWREAAGVSMRDAAECIGGDNSKVSRMETGKVRVTKTELTALLALYGVTDPRVLAGLEGLRAARQKANWWQRYSGDDVPPDLQERLALESETVRLFAFHSMVVPGLLQTQEYAEAVIRGMDRPTTEEGIAKAVAVRMERQAIFGRKDPPQYICVLDEAVLHRQVGGPSVMSAQLEKLQEVSGHPDLSIQVIPFSQGSYAGLDGAFTLYSYPDPLELDVVGLDYLDGGIYLEENAPVERYRRVFDQLRSNALSLPQSMDLISRIARDSHKR